MWDISLPIIQPYLPTLSPSYSRSCIHPGFPSFFPTYYIPTTTAANFAQAFPLPRTVCSPILSCPEPFQILFYTLKHYVPSTITKLVIVYSCNLLIHFFFYIHNLSFMHHRNQMDLWVHKLTDS